MLFWGEVKVDLIVGKYWLIVLFRLLFRCIRRVVCVDWLLKEESMYVNFRFKVFFLEKVIFCMGNLL